MFCTNWPSRKHLDKQVTAVVGRRGSWDQRAKQESCCNDPNVNCRNTTTTTSPLWHRIAPIRVVPTSVPSTVDLEQHRRPCHNSWGSKDESSLAERSFADSYEWQFSLHSKFTILDRTLGRNPFLGIRQGAHWLATRAVDIARKKGGAC